MPTVTHTRKEQASDAQHTHIAGVCTTANVFYTRAEVVAGLDAGQSWETEAAGNRARIRKITYCPAAGCYTSPYITTDADDTAANNLNNLPPC
jgi:Protein of unknown function (DUF3892)